MELSLLDRPLQSLLGCPRSAKQQDIQSQWVRFSIDIWTNLGKQLNILKEIRILTWPIYEPDFELAVEGGGFTQWERRGFTSLCLLVENRAHIDFKTMSERWGFTGQDFYRYLQLRHYFHKNVKRLIPRNLTGITKMFIKAYNKKMSRKIIGELYSYIVEL